MYRPTCVDRLMHWLCLYGSFVGVTLGRYHDSVTGDKYDCYRDIVRVCSELELEHDATLSRLTYFASISHPCHSDV